MKFTFLVDNRVKGENFENEHGLSILIEINNKKILLDSGSSDKFIKNSKKLGIDIKDIDIMILSHGHYDHGDGIKYLFEGLKILAHPEIFTERYSLRTKKYAGIELSKDQLKKRFNLIESKEPYKIFNNIYFLGEIPRINNFESKIFPTILKDGSIDIVKDDSGVVIKSDKGLIIFSGCAHSGICNTIEYSKKITKTDKIYSVIGGFHLKKDDKQLKETILYLKNNNIDNLYFAHCTTDSIYQIVKKELKNRMIKLISTGESYFL